MTQHDFYDDYSEGGHPKVLEALLADTHTQQRTYGTDAYSVHVRDVVRKYIGSTAAEVYFVGTGTHANIVGQASMLKPYEAVIAPTNGHTYTYEAGSLEATGHRIITVPATDGKLHPESIQEVVDSHNDEHQVVPRVVYISQLTEMGTMYSKAELEAISAVCKKNSLYLYIDGARLSHALASEQADVTLAELANLVDMFYLGGTKNGALLGEALVIMNPELNDHFKYHLRQRGALLAKSRSVSQQFLTLLQGESFEESLYYANAKHANTMAQTLAAGIEAAGYSLQYQPAGNQVFASLPNTVVQQLKEQYGFYEWGPDATQPGHTIVRLVTSWATPEEVVDQFCATLKAN